jgi:hypothetical protein
MASQLQGSGEVKKIMKSSPPEQKRLLSQPFSDNYRVIYIGHLNLFLTLFSLMQL